MKPHLLSLTLFLISFHLSYGQPTDNPVASYYGNGNYPLWTNQIKWDNIIDMSTYTNGSNTFERFENARDELYSQGGGVLYYPAGTYDFSDMPSSGRSGRGLPCRRRPGL